MNIKYFVRTTGERILDKSYNQIEYELLIDKEHKPVESFIKQLKIISEYDSVLLEDDLILCDNFKNVIEDIINKYPNMIINFYSKHFKETTKTNIIYSNQCTYYPKHMSLNIANVMQKYLPYPNYDGLETKALKELNIYIIEYKPNIVIHKNGYSLITKRYRFN